MALRQSCRTIAYCEIDRVCRGILENNMTTGFLDLAPIHPDIRTMDIQSLRKEKPLGVTMGFPCQDISAAGSGSGIEGSRSRLFFEAIRVITHLPSVRWIFMENSPVITSRGLDIIVEQLASLDFNIRWDILSARDVGAPQQRKRWFCFAWKRAVPVFPPQPLSFEWGKEPVKRLVACSNRAECTVLRSRNGRLGNAVVPQCAAVALYLLSNGVKEIKKASHEANLHLTLRDGKGTMYGKRLWATPCSSAKVWYVGNLNKRTSTVLNSQLFFEENSQKLVARLSRQGGNIIANPNFVEWLQGYPLNWTQTP